MAKAAKKPPALKTKEGRQHDATYASDKRTGGWMVRVVGPHSNAFAGREIPVRKRDGEEHMETLTRLVWTGTDTGTDEQPGTGQPCSLYHFKAKPREELDDEIPF